MNFQAKFNFWLNISIIVAKEFRLKPSTVYKEWESREVLITYGVIMNDMAQENLANYNALKSDKEPSKPKAYNVAFITKDMIIRMKNLEDKEKLFEKGKLSN